MAKNPLTREYHCLICLLSISYIGALWTKAATKKKHLSEIFIHTFSKLVFLKLFRISKANTRQVKIIQTTNNIYSRNKDFKQCEQKKVASRICKTES